MVAGNVKGLEEWRRGRLGELEGEEARVLRVLERDCVAEEFAALLLGGDMVLVCAGV